MASQTYYCVENLLTHQILEFFDAQHADAHYKHMIQDDPENGKHWLMYDHTR